MLKHSTPARPRMRLVVSAIAFGLMSAVALAQDTSSSVTGRVLDGEGKPVAGALVEILHTPSGTRKVVTTDENGRYSSKGLRVGGGFVVSVSKDGMDATKADDVELRLGEVGTVNLVMGGGEEVLGEVVVTAARTSDLFDSTKMGAASNVTRDQIEALPSINRSIEDYVRLDPRLVQVDKDRGGISAAGQNNRYNNITIDGVSSNDEFGLNDSGFASLGNPISIDAIEELNINVASYDVSQSDSTGANINAVTKSGTNDFKGTVYGVYRKNNWVGDGTTNTNFTGFNDEKTYGFTVGGPILQDRLFFFLAYEKFERSAPAPSVNRRIVNGISTQFVSDADLAAIAARAQVLGFNIGQSSLSALSTTDDKVIAKIDWNISDQHRASVRYGRTPGQTQRTPDVNSTSVSTADHWYFDNVVNKNLTGQLYSDWTDSFSTEVSLSRADYSSIPQNASFTPQVTVRVNNGVDQVVFGTERSRQSNVLESNTSVGFLKGNYFIGDHTASFGVDYKKNDTFNLFLQDTNGTYSYASIADFQAGRINRYQYNFPVTSTDRNSVAANFALKSYGFFLQDNWVVNNNLTINYGFRFDQPSLAERPKFNQAALAAFGYDNSETLDGNYVFQPRAGFNYTFDSDVKTQIRGGVGLFAGSSPSVWLSNSFSNTGLLSSGYNLTSTATVPLPFTFVLDPNNQPRPVGAPPTPNIDFVSKNFEQPTTWKGSLAFERELPWLGLVGSAEYILTQTDNNLFYENLNLGTPTGRNPDGRLSYWTSNSAANFLNPNLPIARNRANQNRAFGNVLLLRNTTKGYSEVLTVGVTRPMIDNWTASLAYTFSDGEDSNPGASSTSFSSWSNRLVLDPNDDVASRSNYIFRDRITGNMSIRHEFFDGAPTTFSAFYEGRSGRPFSYGFIGDANGDGATNDLFYIPKPGEAIFRGAGVLLPGTATNPARVINDPVVEAAFFNYINSVEYLRTHQGQNAERNAKVAPWLSQIDIRISQDLPMVFKVQPQIYLDISNFGNLINKKYGNIDEATFPYNVNVARFAGVQDGKYVYQFLAPPAGFTRKDVKGESRWAAQIGVKFSF
jgi:outer membrane receptor protein involved in Fe transport